MNPLSLTVKKLCSMLKFVIDRRANWWADAQTDRVITIIGTRIVARPNYYTHLTIRALSVKSKKWPIINVFCIVLGPCTALCRLFLKHCTLTNKAVGTIWRALSKPPQRRQGPDLRPLWLLVGTPSAIRPELAFSRAEHSLPYSDVTIYIFAILYLSSMPNDFYDLSAWGGCWFVVYIRRFIYKFLNVCPFD